LAGRLLHREHLDDAVADQKVIAVAVDGRIRDEVVEVRVVREPGRIDHCRRSVTDPNRLGGCIGRVVNGLHQRVDAAVSNARVLFPAGGACERALRIYAHSLSAYTAALTWFDQGAGQRPYSRVGLIGLRQHTRGAAGSVFGACGSFL